MLAQQLIIDPSSHVFAAVAGMPHPWTREAFILADLVDTIQYTNVARKDRSKVKPYPRPVQHPDRNTTRSTKPTLSQHRIRAALAMRGHGRPSDG
jgi:hypothetical protein